jgi:hypothetical protein
MAVLAVERCAKVVAPTSFRAISIPEVTLKMTHLCPKDRGRSWGEP